MVSLREAVDPDTRGNLSRFARQVGVSWTTAWRWTLPAAHKRYNIPLPKYWQAITVATGGQWQPPYDAFSGVPLPRPPRRPPHVSVAASRKAAATRRRQAQHSTA